MNVFPGTGAGINRARVGEFLKGGAIERKAFALVIGRERAAAIRPLLPLKAEPAKVFQHGRDEFRFATGSIKVFIA